MNIILVCSAGMSTSIMMRRMEEAAHERKIEVNIQALAEAELKNKLETADVILIGPQVRYLSSKIEKLAEPYGIKVSVIPSVDFGMMNGKNVLAHAENLLAES